MTHRYIKIGATAAVLVLAFVGLLWTTLQEGTEWYIIEHETSKTPLTVVKACLDNLRKMTAPRSSPSAKCLRSNSRKALFGFPTATTRIRSGESKWAMFRAISGNIPSPTSLNRCGESR